MQTTETGCLFFKIFELSEKKFFCRHVLRVVPVYLMNFFFLFFNVAVDLGDAGFEDLDLLTQFFFDELLLRLQKGEKMSDRYIFQRVYR